MLVDFARDPSQTPMIRGPEFFNYLNLIQDVLLAGLASDEDRSRVAQRIFLVVSQGDVRTGVNREEIQQETLENVRKVAEAITPDFFERYQDHIFLDVMAQPALIAQLSQAFPQEADVWRRGENPWPFDVFNYRDYSTTVAWAQEETQLEEPFEAVMTLSLIPQLRAALNRFASNSRWELDLTHAAAHYRAAHAHVTEWIRRQWEPIVGGTMFENAQPVVNIDQLREDRFEIYGKHVQAQAQEVLERFDRARDALAQRDSLQAMTRQLSWLFDQIKIQIETRTREPGFRTAFLQEIEDPIPRTYYITFGAPKPLIELHTLVLQWLDMHVHTVAQEMIQAFHNELRSEDVESFLKQICREQPYTDRYMENYRDQVIGWIEQQYQSACRGSLLYQMLQYEVPREVISKVAEFGRVEENRSANKKDYESQLMEVIYNAYNEARINTIGILTKHFVNLFFYHLTIARSNLEAMTSRLGLRLAMDIKEPDGNLFTKIEDEHADRLGYAERLVGWYQKLQDIMC